MALPRLRLHRGFALLTLVVFAGLWWQGPLLIRRVPSRYLARLPQPLQTLVEPADQAPLLPTVPPPRAAAARLLGVPGPPPTLPAPLVTISEAAPGLPTPATPAEATPVAVATRPAPTPASPPPPPAVRLQGFSHQFQTWNNCGPATLAMALSYFGLNLSQKTTAAILKPNPEDRNVSPHEMVSYVNEHTSFQALYRVDGTLETLKRLLAAGFPVIIELGIEPPGEYRWLGWYGHYLLLVAYDETAEQFWVYDSWFGTSDVPMENATTEGRALPYAAAEQQWRQFNRTYLVFYEQGQGDEVGAIVGAAMDDSTMWQAALARVQAELQQEPEEPFLWFNLGSIYLARGQAEEAALAFDQARSIGLPWRMLWYQFGPYEAYYQMGRYDDVLLLADTTLKERPYFEEAFYYKGLALAARGDLKAARDNWQRAVTFNPHFVPAVRALEDGSP